MSWRERQAPLEYLPGRYERRRGDIPQTHLRAISLEQLEDLGAFVAEELDAVAITDSYNNHERIGFESVNMYHICDHFVKYISCHVGGSEVCQADDRSILLLVC